MRDDFIRIEYKLDLIIQALISAGIMVPELPPLLGIQEDCCPVCNQPIRVIPDFKNETVRYCCACSVPNKVVSGISELLTPNEDQNNASKRTNQDVELLQQEKDRSSDG